ncbi:golgin subfamily A member 2-like [Cimex lectularius]|uniref:Uncharacterized protein n=1 Tax=Cimex lectularius TaxID=79782 RepID=A0A8I6TH95_CIMLE|nr:golgin subfamily A member 2-like [Cimex lectularius]
MELVKQAELDLLAEISRVLQDRSNEVERHRQLLLHVADLKQKVRRQKIQINQMWAKMKQEEQKEIDFLTAEKDNIEMQIKQDHIAGSKDTLHKIQQPDVLNSKGNKPPPSRVGNYTIMAKRLQGEIKHLEQNVNDMKARLQTELEHKASIESKVKEMRSSLTLHRRQDTFTAPTTPIQ